MAEKWYQHWKPGKISKHASDVWRRLDAKDLPQLLRDMDGYVGGEHTRLALQLMALTFVRTGELIGAKRGEFDLDAARWNIPAERMKMRTPHIVPLSKQAVSYSREFVFPADTGKPTHMSNNTILHEQAFNHAHIELQLAHQERDNVSAAYNHALYLAPRAKMMQAWADHLDALRVKNVVAIRRA